MNRRRRSVAHIVLLMAALAFPAAARPGERTFASGSLIIPASVEYQSDNGLLAMYSMIYSVLYMNSQPGEAQIKVYWAIAPNKLSPYRCVTNSNTLPDYSTYNDNDGCDFYVQRAVADGGKPVSLIDRNGAELSLAVNNITYDPTVGPERASSTHAVDGSTSLVKYLGGSWIIDSTDAEAFMQRLRGSGFDRFRASNSSLYVNIHRANHDFRAPVASVVKEQPPRIAVVGSSGQTDKLTDVLVNAGLCSSNSKAGFFTTCEGIVYNDFTDTAATLLGSATTSGTLTNANPSVGPVFGLLWLGDGAFGNNTTTGSDPIPAAQRATIQAFLNAKGNVFAEYNTIGAMEWGHYQSTDGVVAVTSENAVPPNEDCNDKSTFSVFKGGGSACVIYKGANLPFAQAGNFYYEQGGNGNWQGYNGTFKLPTGTAPGTYQIAREGQLANGVVTASSMIASASYYQHDPSKGLIMYLAGHKYSSPPKYWGQRIILNTIFARTDASGSELSRSEPVAYVTPSTSRVYQGTYIEELLPDVDAMVTYDVDDPTMWLFPYTEGHLYEYNLSSLTSTEQAFAFSTANPDAGAVLKSGTPMPYARNVWTYVAAGTHASASIGWKRIQFTHTEVGTTPGTPCTADTNGVCLLSKALLSYGNVAGIQLSELASPTTNANQAKTLGRLVSQMRGSCVAAATVTGARQFEPLDSDCAPRSSTDMTLPTLNRARLGGIDHGSPAVVGPSRYITAAPFDKRPVVAYAAGYDGMLHAFYVSDWNGGTSASWQGATSANVSNLSLLAGATRMQELWAIAPPGQVGLMFSNNALLDGSINVVDVFADFPRDTNHDGVIDWTAASSERPTGTREWRTVLVVTAGRGSSHWGIGGSEMFALDVTNPLDPVLLWHLGGATENDGRAYDPAADAWSAFDANGSPSDPTQFALKWVDTLTTDYNPSTQSAINALKTGRYDYRNLGLAYSTAIAKIWSGASYQYALFVASSAAEFPPAVSGLFNNAWYTYARWPEGGVRGVQVFGIDLITGKKLWQWQHLYASATGAGVDNSVPPRIALGDIDANGSVDRVYVGDLEGRVWELSARDGRNWNYLLASDRVRYSFPLFGTETMTGGAAADAVKAPFRLNDGTTDLSQQPLTTPIGQGRFTAVPTDQQPYLMNRLALIVGTMGVDWPIAKYESGHVYVLPISPDMGTRLAEPVDLTVTRDPKKYGVLLPYPANHPEQSAKHAWWDLTLDTNERVYGMPRVINNQIIFNTAFGSFSRDVSLTLTDAGRFWKVSANSAGEVATPTPVTNNTKAFAGVLVVGNNVVITTANKIKKLDNEVTTNEVATSPFNRTTPAALKSWEIVR